MLRLICSRIKCRLHLPGIIKSNSRFISMEKMVFPEWPLWKPGTAEYHGIWRNITEYRAIKRNMEEYFIVMHSNFIFVPSWSTYRVNIYQWISMPGSCDVIHLPNTVNQYLLDGVSKIYNWTLMKPLILPSVQKFQNNRIFNKSILQD